MRGLPGSGKSTFVKAIVRMSEEEEVGGGGQRRGHLLLHIGRYVGRHFIRGCVTKYTVLVRRKAQNDDHNETGKEQNDSSAEEAQDIELFD